MPIFHYRALDGTGALVKGTMDVADERAAAQALQRDGHVPVEISQTPRVTLRDVLDIEITPRSALSPRDRIGFTRSLATLLQAGLPLDRALGTLEELGANKPTREVAGRLLETVRGGAALSAALEQAGSAFPPLYLGIVRAGETGAALGPALEDLADMLEEGAKRTGEIRSALIYPAFLVATAMGAVGILLGFVVPTFEPLLADAGVDLPAITELVIGAGRFAENWGLWVLGGWAVSALIFALALRAPETRLAWDRGKLRLPVLGPALLKFETARLARTLATMLGNGVPLPTAIRMAEGAVGNRAIAAELERVLPEVEAGRGLAAPLREGGVLPPMALQLIQVGQESGDLSPMLRKLSDMYAADAKRAFDQMLTLLTPVITLTMAVVIGVIITSILYALFSLNELAI